MTHWYVLDVGISNTVFLLYLCLSCENEVSQYFENILVEFFFLLGSGDLDNGVSPGLLDLAILSLEDWL